MCYIAQDEQFLGWYLILYHAKAVEEQNNVEYKLVSIILHWEENLEQYNIPSWF